MIVSAEWVRRELTRRGIEHSPSVEQFADGLETLADLFGKDKLRAKWKEASSFSRWSHAGRCKRETPAWSRKAGGLVVQRA